MRAADRAVLGKLFLAERAARGRPPAEAFDRFLASLTPREARHPLAAWIAGRRDALDWDENVCDLVSACFGLPQKPLWPSEQGNGYEEAAARLERQLLAGPGGARAAGG